MDNKAHSHLRRKVKHAFSSKGTTVRLGKTKGNPHPKMK